MLTEHISSNISIGTVVAVTVAIERSILNQQVSPSQQSSQGQKLESGW